ncbi:MAG TPA: 16S rRNA (guanine(966)-N(2))-methyltransferase RsmD [Verrucomicrobiae bacterium]|nr:16S rRNA (guanine(966)-N(2))-methyltransferase RsmD [Verrucomicrobiae bacterium]
MARGERGAGRLRVVGGEARGRPLLTPPGRSLRPTTALVRRALFDIVGAGIVGASVVDAYAGVGGVGLEALSRGAATVTFVERDRMSLTCLRSNVDRLGYAARATVVAAAVRPWLARHPLAPVQLVVCDPPYASQTGDGVAPGSEAEQVLGAIADNLERWPGVGAPAPSPAPLVVVEHHRGVELPAAVGPLACIRAERYGTTMLSFYRRAR